MVQLARELKGLANCTPALVFPTQSSFGECKVRQSIGDALHVARSAVACDRTFERRPSGDCVTLGQAKLCSDELDDGGTAKIA
jgi:hypothetical protein